jgi:hypothetical protein
MKNKTDSVPGFAFCSDELERKYMVKSISAELPDLDLQEIEEAVYTCCRDIKNENLSAGKRFELLECLLGKLSL